MMLHMPNSYLFLIVLGLQHFVSCLSESLIVRSFLFRAAWASDEAHSLFGFLRFFPSDVEEEEWLFILLRSPVSLDSLHSPGDPGGFRR